MENEIITLANQVLELMTNYIGFVVAVRNSSQDKPRRKSSKKKKKKH